MRFTGDFRSDSDASEQQSDDSDNSSAAPPRRQRSTSQKGGRARGNKVRTLNRWTAEEHDKLAYLVDKWGSEKNWAKVAEEMPGRTGKQCRERWLNHMKPGIIKGNWSQEEEFLLAQCHALVGSHWSKMTKRLPGRTENSIKNFWNATLRSKAPNKKRGMLWTYMQLHDPKSDDNTLALTTAISRLHETRELPPGLLAQLDAQLLDSRTWKAVHKAEKEFLENVGGELHALSLTHPGAVAAAAAAMDVAEAAAVQHQAYLAAAAAAAARDAARMSYGGGGGAFLGTSHAQLYAAFASEPADIMVCKPEHGMPCSPRGSGDGYGLNLAAASQGGSPSGGAACGQAGRMMHAHQLAPIPAGLQQGADHCLPDSAPQYDAQGGGGASGSFQLGHAGAPMQPVGRTSVAVMQLNLAGSGGSSSAAASQEPVPEHLQHQLSPAGSAEPAVPSDGAPALHALASDQATSRKFGGATTRQLAAVKQDFSKGGGRSALASDTGSDTSRLDHGAPAVGRAGGHGPQCSCGPCVNSRKLHGLHSPSARRHQRNASAGSRGRSLAPAASKLQQQQLSACHMQPLPHLQQQYGGDEFAQLAALHAQSGGGADFTVDAACYVQQRGMQQQQLQLQQQQQQQPRCESPFAGQPAAASWEGLPLVAEAPMAGSQRPAQCLVLVDDGGAASQAVVIPEPLAGLPWLCGGGAERQQPHHLPPPPLGLQLAGGDAAAALHPQQPALLLQGVPTQLVSAAPPTGSRPQQLAAGRPQLGLDLGLALASPIGMRLGMAGLLDGACAGGSAAGSLAAAEAAGAASAGADHLGMPAPQHGRPASVRLPSFGQIILQRASVSALDWDWEGLLSADACHSARPSQQLDSVVAGLGFGPGPLSGFKRARCSVTSIDDDGGLLIDMQPTKAPQLGGEAAGAPGGGALYGCGGAWSSVARDFFDAA